MAALENARYEKFIQCLIQGMSQRKAYRNAFPQSGRWKDATVDNKASKLFKRDEIAARYEELQEQAKDKAIMKRKDRMIVLSKIASDRGEKPEARIKAIDTLNKMDGEYVNKVELSGEVKAKNPYEGLTTEELKKLIRDG